MPSARSLRLNRPFALLAFASLVTSCADDPLNENNDPTDAFSTTVEEVVVEIDYQEGAEPYDGTYLTTGPAFSLFEDNVERLFASSTAALTLPSTLSEMQNVGPLEGAESYSSSEIVALAERFRDEASEGTTQSYYVLFLDGLFRIDDEAQSGILGVSIGDTGIIAMFKPVIENIGLVEATRAFGEQTVLIHELGHAIGLVNRGIALQSEHHDEANGAHCTNPDCVMYYQNEGAEEIVSFIQSAITRGDRVLFDDACLQDVDAAGQ